ncbi:MAG: molybdenum cofactor biosynthesis protein MoaE [Thermoplasmata archaeon]
MSVRLSSRRLPLGAALRELEGAHLGGVAVFVGRVRPDRTRTGRVLALLYEADRPLALRALARLETEARRRFGAGRTVAWHRVGQVGVGETAVIVGAACGHRAEAFAATRFLIDELKRTVPVWKEVRARPARRPPRPPSRRHARSTG